MNDPRVARLAELVVGYSLELQEGKIVRLDGSVTAAPLVVELYRAALARGAHPYAEVKLERLAEHLVDAGTEEQIAYVSPIAWQEVERVDAMVTVLSAANTRSFSRADPVRYRRYLASRRALTSRFRERLAAREAVWCGTLFPSHAHAQDAEMSLREYEDFVYAACHVRDGEDAAARWRSVQTELLARAAELDEVRELRILGPDTDLRVVVGGRRWLAGFGKRNLPDGAVFTSPVEDATEGEIRFTFPAVYANREVEDVRLRFESGCVVRAEAAHGEEHLLSCLDLDAEARNLGEVAFGLNYEIDRFTRNILFDEKIGGTMHVALGAGFAGAGGTNRSGLHWDMICDLRQDGEVYADGELVWRAGRFLHEPEPRAGALDAEPTAVL